MRYRIAAGLVCILFLTLCIPLVSAVQVSDIIFPAVPAKTVNTIVTSVDRNFSPENSGYVTGLTSGVGYPDTSTVVTRSGSAAVIIQTQGNLSQPVNGVTVSEAPVLEPINMSVHLGSFVWISGSNTSIVRANEPALLSTNVVLVKSGTVVSYSGLPGTGIIVGSVTNISEKPGIQDYFLGNVSELPQVATTAPELLPQAPLLFRRSVPASAGTLYFTRSISVSPYGQSLPDQQ